MKCNLCGSSEFEYLGQRDDIGDKTLYEYECSQCQKFKAFVEDKVDE